MRTFAAKSYGAALFRPFLVPIRAAPFAASLHLQRQPVQCLLSRRLLCCDVHKAMIAERLTLAEWHVAEGQRRIERCRIVWRHQRSRKASARHELSGLVSAARSASRYTLMRPVQ